MRQEHSKNILDDLESWLSKQLTHISGKSPLAGAVRYALTRIPKVRPYLEHGFLELDNNTAERAMRPIAIGRKNYLFLGSEKGGKSAAICYSLIETCKLNDVNPQSWLTHAPPTSKTPKSQTSTNSCRGTMLKKVKRLL